MTDAKFANIVTTVAPDMTDMKSTGVATTMAVGKITSVDSTMATGVSTNAASTMATGKTTGVASNMAVGMAFGAPSTSAAIEPANPPTAMRNVRGNQDLSETGGREMGDAMEVAIELRDNVRTYEDSHARKRRLAAY